MSYSYRTGAEVVPALSGVSLRFSAGEYVAVLGANGSGKSTLVRLANGLMLPDTGRVYVQDGDTADPQAVDAVRRAVGVVFQNPDDQIVATSVEDDVAFGPENLGLPRDALRARVDDALAAVGLTGLERREPHLLSGGQKQRLAIAGALAMNPAFLLMDEPTSMLDPVGRTEVLAVLSSVVAAGRTVVHVTHDLTEALRAQRAVVLHRGNVVYDGPPVELLDDGGQMAEWGIEIPELLELVRALRAHGAAIPAESVTPESIAEHLCRCD